MVRDKICDMAISVSFLCALLTCLLQPMAVLAANDDSQGQQVISASQMANEAEHATIQTNKHSSQSTPALAEIMNTPTVARANGQTQIAVQPEIIATPNNAETMSSAENVTKQAARAAIANSADPQAAKITQDNGDQKSSPTEKEVNPLSNAELNQQALESVAPNCVALKGKALQACIDKALKGIGTNNTNNTNNTNTPTTHNKADQQTTTDSATAKTDDKSDDNKQQHHHQVAPGDTSASSANTDTRQETTS